MADTRDSNAPRHPRRDELLEVAIRTVRMYGPKASMDEIASAARVTKPTLYRAFGSKQGLYEAVARWFIGMQLEDVVRIFNSDEPHLRDFMTRVLDAVLARIQSEINIYNFLMRRARIELSAGGPETDFLGQFGDAVEALIARQLTLAGIDTTPAPIWAHGIVGMVTSVADWWVENQHVERDAVVKILADLLFEGFAPLSGRGLGPGRLDPEDIDTPHLRP